MSKKITFSAFGRDSYYHRDWFKKNGFKFDRSSRRWTVENLPIEHAEDITAEAERIMAREHIVISAAQRPDFNMDKLRAAWKGMAEIH